MDPPADDVALARALQEEEDAAFARAMTQEHEDEQAARALAAQAVSPVAPPQMVPVTSPSPAEGSWTDRWRTLWGAQKRQRSGQGVGDDENDDEDYHPRARGGRQRSHGRSRSGGFGAPFPPPPVQRDEPMTYEDMLALDETITPRKTVRESQLAADYAWTGPAQTVCVICQDAVQPGDMVNTLSCLHTFHAGELRSWFRTSNKCPVCQVAV